MNVCDICDKTFFEDDMAFLGGDIAGEAYPASCWDCFDKMVDAHAPIR